MKTSRNMATCLTDFTTVFSIFVIDCPAMPLIAKDKQHLKARAHKLKPVVQIGHLGLTAPVNKAIDQALKDHELIKIHIATNDRDLKKALAAKVCKVNKAELVNVIGKIAIVYRKNIEKK